MKLEHGRRAEAPQEMNRREFFRLGAAGAALVAGLQLGIVSFPNTAQAQIISVQGVNVATERLPDNLTNLERSSRSFQRGERTEGRVYSNLVQIPAERYSAVVTMNEENGEKYLSITFPRERDRNPRREGAGTWNAEISSLTNLVKQVSNQDVKRFKLLIARTTDPQQSDPVITVYAIPMDQRGNIIGQHSGGYLAMGASYYPQRGVVYGARSLLLEPGVPEPAAVARR